MNKPNKNLIKLCELGYITEIKVSYRQTGTDTAETFVKITGSGGKVEGLWTTWNPYLRLRIDYNTIAEVVPHMQAEVEAWKDFEKKNAAELATYNRLKKKFETTQ